jgi:hypothetical protein
VYFIRDIKYLICSEGGWGCGATSGGGYFCPGTVNPVFFLLNLLFSGQILLKEASVTNKPQREWWQMSAKERRQKETALGDQWEVLPED